MPDSSKAWFKNYTHEMVADHRVLVREASAAMGYPVCGKPLDTDRVCRMSKNHSGIHA